MSDIVPTNLPPLAAVCATLFLGPTYQQEQLITVDLAVVARLPNNPNRLTWQAINEGANDVRVSNNPNISASSGWLLAASGGIISMDYKEDGEAVGYPVYMIANGVASVIRIREVIRS